MGGRAAFLGLPLPPGVGVRAACPYQGQRRLLPSADELVHGQVRMKAEQDSWGLPTMPGMPGGIRLYQEPVLAGEGLRAKLSIYPATIVQARYGGSYEGAPVAVFPGACPAVRRA